MRNEILEVLARSLCSHLPVVAVEFEQLRWWLFVLEWAQAMPQQTVVVE